MQHAGISGVRLPRAPLAHAGWPPRRASRRLSTPCRCEKKEYYDYKDMPPLPLSVKRIHIPKLGHTIVDTATQELRPASLAIFTDIYRDEQYRRRLNRKSALTSLCMFDRDDVARAAKAPGDYPSIDLLNRIYSEGLDLEFVVEEHSLADTAQT